MKLINKYIFAFLFLIIVSQTHAQDTLLTPQAAVKLALKNNYGLQISRNNIDIASLNNSWAAAGAIPEISASANKVIGVNNLTQQLSNGTTTKKNGNAAQNFNAGLAVNWVIFDGWKMYATKKRLEELELAGEYSLKKNLNETVYNVLESYYNLVTNTEQLQATREQISLYEERYVLSQRKLDIGTGAKYEMLEAEVDLNEQRSIALSLENTIVAGKYTLTELLGLAPDTAFKVQDSIIVQPLPLYEASVEAINQQNIDLLLANNALSILALEKKESNAARLPVITANGFYNFVRNRNTAGFTLLNQTYGPSGSLGVSVPLFNGGLVKRELRAADIRIKNQELSIADLKNKTLSNLSKAYSQYANSVKVIALEKNNLRLAEENISIARERYRLLNITAVELRQIQISYQAAKNRLYTALYQAKMATAQVALLTGNIEGM